MSTMKICPKCNSEKFKVNLVAEGMVSIAVTEAGNEYQLISQGDLGIDNSVLVCSECGESVTEDKLVDGMISNVSNKYYPIDQLVQVEVEGGGVQIMTQAEYEAMTAPTIDTMDETQLRETAKQQASALEAMQAQMQALMAQMATLQSGGAQAQAAPTQPTTPAKATTKKAPEVQVQTPTVATNIPVPEAAPEVNIIDPTNINPEESVPVDSFFGSEAPF